MFTGTPATKLPQHREAAALRMEPKTTLSLKNAL
jgi:hypothetical protein